MEKGMRAKLLFVLLTGFVTQSVYSATSPVPPHSVQPVAHTDKPNWNVDLHTLLSQYVISLSGFQSWQSTNTKQTINLTPQITKAYVSNPSTQALGTGELFVGVYQPINKTFEWQLGLALGVTGDTRINGNIWDDDDSHFNNYSYSYMVRTTHIDVKGKILADIGMALIPWVSGGLGFGFNQAHNFTSNPSIFQAVPTPNFSSNTTVAWNYSIGVGVQLPFTDNWEVGVGYEFANLGKSQLGKAPGQTMSGSGPVLNQLYTSSVLLNLSYLA
jgi:opacity protein-like surface antigen